MSDYSEDFNAMLKRMFIGCDEYLPEIALVPGFSNPYEALRKVTIEIDAISLKKGSRITGMTVAKHLDKYGLSGLAGDIATITCGYAFAINDAELAKDLDYTSSGILKLRDEEISKISRNIYDRAIEHKEDLLNYGITLEKFDKLDGMIIEWDSTSQMNLTAWKQKRIYTAQILVQVKEGKSILNNILDKVIVSFKDSCPKLVQMYNTHRHTIIRTNSRRIEMGTILGFVYVKDEEIPITAIVSIKGPGIDKRIESYMDGEYTFAVPVGKYIVSAEKPEFITKTFNDVEIKSDEDLLLNFELEKVVVE